MKKMLITGSGMLSKEHLRQLEKTHIVTAIDREADNVELARLLAEADIYVLGGDELVTESVLAGSAVTRIIFVGVQWETSFTAEARRMLDERRIKVQATGGGIGSVAETAIRIISNPNHLRSMAAKRGLWQPDHRKIAAGMKVVVLGTGRIGTRVACGLKPLFPHISYFSRTVSKPELEECGIARIDDLKEAFEGTDIMSVHLAYAEGKTDDIITPQLIRLMADDGVLINTARAQLIKDLPGFAEVVASQSNRQYYFDVFWREGAGYQELFNDSNEASPEEKTLRMIATSPNFHLFCHTAAVSEDDLARATQEEYGNMLFSLLKEESP